MKPILIVDDDEVDVMAFRRLCTRTGILNPIAVARDGESALAILRDRKKRPLLCLLDVRMATMDGFELLERIRGDEDLCDLPCIMLTSSERPKDIDVAERRQADGYLIKPVSAQQLIACVATAGLGWALKERQ